MWIHRKQTCSKLITIQLYSSGETLERTHSKFSVIIYLFFISGVGRLPKRLVMGTFRDNCRTRFFTSLWSYWQILVVKSGIIFSHLSLISSPSPSVIWPRVILSIHRGSADFFDWLPISQVTFLSFIITIFTFRDINLVAPCRSQTTSSTALYLGLSPPSSSIFSPYHFSICPCAVTSSSQYVPELVTLYIPLSHYWH